MHPFLTGGCYVQENIKWAEAQRILGLLWSGLIACSGSLRYLSDAVCSISDPERRSGRIHK